MAVVVLVCSPSTVTTAKGSGRRNTSLLASESAATTGRAPGRESAHHSAESIRSHDKGNEGREMKERGKDAPVTLIFLFLLASGAAAPLLMVRRGKRGGGEAVERRRERGRKGTGSEKG
jgi:hypothetical protein